MAAELNLDAYVYSLESTRSTQRWVIDAYRDLSDMRRLIRAMNDASSATGDSFQTLVNDLAQTLTSLASHVGQARTPNVTRLLQLVDETAEINRKLAPSDQPMDLGKDEATLRSYIAQVTAQEPRLKRQVALVRDSAAFSPT
jgi:hypothetical protein